MTTVLIVQTLVRMKKKQNFSDEELMQVMGLDLPSSKSGTETHAPVPGQRHKYRR